MGAESARGIGLRPVNSRASFGLSGACLVALAIVGCASTPPEQDPVQIKLNDIDTRLARIERMVTNQSMLDLVNQKDSQRKDLLAMRYDDVDLTIHLTLSC